MGPLRRAIVPRIPLDRRVLNKKHEAIQAESHKTYVRLQTTFAYLSANRRS